MGDNASGGKCIEARELRCSNRQNLAEVVPLATPYLMYIEPANVCNFRCAFCPTGDHDLIQKVGRPQGFMDMELFRKIVEELQLFDSRLKLASLYKDGEPLLHPEFPEMVRILKAANVAERIWTKTNGALLNPELSQRIVDAGLDMICISVEAVSSKGYKKIAGVSIDYEQFRKNIQDLYQRRSSCEIYVKIANSGFTSEEIAKFYEDFQSISTYIGVENLMGWSYSGIKDFTLGTHPTTYDGLPFTPKEVCPYPLYVMAVNFNGTVSLCGNDWSHNTVIGDCRRSTLQEIWNGESLFQFRKMMLEGRRRENPACGDCQYLLIVPDNIDADAGQILKSFECARSAAQPDERNI